MVPGALCRLVSRKTLPKPINNEISSSKDPLLCLNFSPTPSTPVLTTALSTLSGSPSHCMVVTNTCAQRVSYIGVHSMHTLPKTPPSFADVNEIDDHCWDDIDDVDFFDIKRTSRDSSHVHSVLDSFSSPLGLDNVLTVQCADDHCQTVLALQSTMKDEVFVEDSDEPLKRKLSHGKTVTQVFVPGFLLSRLLTIL